MAARLSASEEGLLLKTLFLFMVAGEATMSVSGAAKGSGAYRDESGSNAGATLTGGK